MLNNFIFNLDWSCVCYQTLSVSPGSHSPLTPHLLNSLGECSGVRMNSQSGDVTVMTVVICTVSLVMSGVRV